MRLLIDKKIYLFVLIFLTLVTVNNKEINNFDKFIIQKINLNGLDPNDEFELLKKLKKNKLKNIFFIKKNDIENLLNEHELIESYEIYKRYPSDLNINVIKAKFLANISIDNQLYFIGSNQKFIKSKKIDKALPTIFGKPTTKEFFIIKRLIKDSNVQFNDLEKLYFFPSKRWDLEFKNGNMVKLPISFSKDILNKYYVISKSAEFKNIKIYDMRVKNQLITNEF